jgi:tetrachloro-p-hydroquinone reductive dehalogenase
MLEKPIQDPLSVPGAIRSAAGAGSTATALDGPYLAPKAQRPARTSKTAEATAPQASAGDVTLYHFPTSLCSQKVRVALEEKGVPWESHIVNIGPAFEQYEPWYVQLNERMVVPTLEIAGEDSDTPSIITDSRAILRAVDQRFDGPALIPEDDGEREQMERWLELQDGLALRELTYARLPGISGWLLRWSFRTRIKRLEKLGRKHEEHAEAYARKLTDVKRWRSTVADRAAVKRIETEVEAALDELERALATRPYAAGGNYSLADVTWTVVLGRLEHLKLSRLWDDGGRPKVAAYFHRMRGRSSSLHATNTLDTWQKIKLLARVVLPKLIMAWLIKVAVFWIGARVIEMLAQ